MRTKSMAWLGDKVGMVNTDIKTSIGTIKTPENIGNGPWDLKYRVEVAKNAFGFMHDHVFSPSAESASNLRVIQDYFKRVWSAGNVQWAQPPQKNHM